MRAHRKMLTAAGAAMIVITSGAAPGLATETPPPRNDRPEVTITTSIEQRILWVETGVGALDGKLSVKIFAPRRGSGRSLWQLCRFSLSGQGTYRCGLDVASSKSPGGRWIARAFVDGRLDARHVFRPKELLRRDSR